MTIAIGDTIPECTLKIMGAEGPQDISTAEIFKGKKVVLFALPGAFTPGCSKAHLPGYVASADKIKDKGVDSIACLSVNDAFVMGAWGKAQNASEILMLADGNCELTSKLGLVLDGTGFGMGQRSRRYSLVAEDGVVTALNIEPAGDIGVSSAEHMLQSL